MQAERNNLIYHSCKSDVVENLTPFDLWVTFVNIALTIHPTYSKLYIFVILITSRVIWYTWKVIWSIFKIWPPLDPCVTPTGKGSNRPKFCQNIFWPIMTSKPSITHFRQNDTWVLLLILRNYDFCENVKFGAISWKIDILSITAYLKFESKNPFAHLWYI